ncbi:MAG: hypothetical protein KatS3mg008_0266 [Acidimicrobiales bacterium]|nr:MAG: hypothetical protein KatS3mg008_0266 [Acidimicrobiales bacterium]
MPSLGSGEILVVALVALLVLGPERLPEAIRGVAKFIGQLRSTANSFSNELREALDEAVEVEARERGRRTDAAASEERASPDGD